MTPDWNQITQQYGPIVWQAVFRLLQSHAESLDCYQDVMVEAFERCEREPIRNWPAFLRWLAVRRAIDRLRSNTRQGSIIDSAQDVELVATASSPSAQRDLDELLSRLRRELTKLPPQHSEAFWLKFVEQMSNVDIAEQLGVNANSVGVLIHRARQRVCNAIADLSPQTTDR